MQSCLRMVVTHQLLMQLKKAFDSTGMLHLTPFKGGTNRFLILAPATEDFAALLPHFLRHSTHPRGLNHSQASQQTPTRHHQREMSWESPRVRIAY